MFFLPAYISEEIATSHGFLAMTVVVGSLLHIRFIVPYRWCIVGFLTPPYHI